MQTLFKCLARAFFSSPPWRKKCIQQRKRMSSSTSVHLSHTVCFISKNWTKCEKLLIIAVSFFFFKFLTSLLLSQLEIFLSQRIAEMSEEADILSVSQFQRAPPILQDQTKERLEAMMAVIQNLIGQLTNLRMQHLFMILASPR